MGNREERETQRHRGHREEGKRREGKRREGEGRGGEERRGEFVSINSGTVRAFYARKAVF
jgi:hypothetical protein